MYIFRDDYPVRRIPVRPGGGAQASDNFTERQSAETRNRPQPATPPDGQQNTGSASETDWQNRAMRLQADMENFRRRQERRTSEAVAAERERLLSLTLSVADNLARALNQGANDGQTLRQGVELTYRELMRQLAAEGVTRIETVGHAFDPNWHEAVASVPAQAEPNTVVEEIEAGYKLEDKLLRPARVVVAA